MGTPRQLKAQIELQPLGGEALREALLALRQQYAALQQTSTQSEQLLDALDSLLVLEAEEDPFLQVFASLRKVFTFSHALMLEEPAGVGPSERVEMRCLVADPDWLTGSVWPAGPTFRKVLAGRVVVTLGIDGAIERLHATGLGLSSAQPALYVPVRVRDRRGVLVLLRPEGDAGFDRGHVELARRFAVLVSHAMASRHATQSAAEGQRLRELTAQLRQSEQAAHRNASLLNHIVSHLPVGLAVQDQDGRLIVINEGASAVMGMASPSASGQVPFGLDGALPSVQDRRRASFQRQLDGDRQRSTEREVVMNDRRRTMLVTSKPVQVLDERLLVTALLDITDRKRYEQELAQRAYHDDLTGLPNRSLIQELIEAALRDGPASPFALAFIDLDNFKRVNDHYSHAIGDGLLRAVAQRILQHIRPGDTLARISGDEFLLLIDPLPSAADLPLLVDRVVEALKQPFRVEGHELLTSASVGASIYPLHGDNYEVLCRSADHAMYGAKRDRKGSVAYFDPNQVYAPTARTDLEQQLRVAIRQRQFRTAFQPKVDLATGRVLGFEALIRWVTPEGEVRMPGSFIELATELGLLDQLTHFVVDDVIACLPTFVQRHGDDVSVSLNIGARQAGDVAFMATLTQRLAGPAARRVVLELTEDALVAAERFQRLVLPTLRDMGVRVSIDDFGTGYSSLAMLGDVIADEVKVDRAFITNLHERPRSQGILRAVESLCSALGINVVAEGVETVEELHYLRQHSAITCAQGYYFGKPSFLECMPLATHLPTEHRFQYVD